MIETSTEPSTSPDKNRAAIFLIHGVGQQKPYQMLDTFARGLIDHYGDHIEVIEPRLFRSSREDKVRSSINLHFKYPIGRSQIQELDLIEFYWAGMAQGKVTLRQMLRWAFKTSIPPLKLWSQQTSLPTDPPKGYLHLLPTLLRELGTSFALLLAIGLVIFPIPYIIVHLGAFRQAGNDLLLILQTLNDNSPGLFGAIIIFILLLIELLIILSIGQIAFRLRKHRNMETRMLKRWGLSSSGLFLILALLTGGIISLSSLPEWSIIGQIGRLLVTPPVGSGLFSLGLAYVAGQFMIHFVGDIPLYVDADEKSAFYHTRRQIKQAGVATLTSLLDDASPYKAVYVVGHSLGSVIAYDCLNQIIREQRAGRPYALSRLRGLLTFGSPLDKIYYFFRDNVGDKQAVRAQIQSFLHGFRKKSSGRDYGPYRFARYSVPPLKDLQWINVYSPMDIVSDRLDFYQVDEQIQLNYLSPISAHSSYWVDSRFYCILATLLEARTSYKACREAQAGQP